jgi:hypothetical protein
MKCPKCGELKCTLSGKKIRRKGTVQAATCKRCGYRGPVEKFRAALPAREEVRVALGGIDPPWLPGCSIGVPVADATRGGIKYLSSIRE